MINCFLNHGGDPEIENPGYRDTPWEGNTNETPHPNVQTEWMNAPITQEYDDYVAEMLVNYYPGDNPTKDEEVKAGTWGKKNRTLGIGRPAIGTKL